MDYGQDESTYEISRNPYSLKKKTFITEFIRIQRIIISKKTVPKWAHYLLAIFDALQLHLIRRNIDIPGSATHIHSGKTFSIRSTNTQFESIYRDDYQRGYEPEIEWCFQAFATPNSLFVDVGSNWGHHSVNAALKYSMRCLAVEANPMVAQDLRKIITELQRGGVIEVICKAVTNSNGGPLKLVQKTAKSGMGSIDEQFLERIRVGRFNKAIEFEVEGISLDSLSVQPAILKIDTEGSGIDVIESGMKTELAYRPILILEWEPSYAKNQRWQEISRLLQKNSFMLLVFSVRGSRLQVERKEIDEFVKEIGTIKRRHAQSNIAIVPIEKAFQRSPK